MTSSEDWWMRGVDVAGGPVERALAPVLNAVLARLDLAALPAEHVWIAPSPRYALGDFVWDLRPLIGSDRAAIPVCRKIAAHVAETDCIDDALAVFPRVYVRPSLRFLMDAAREITRMPETYGNASDYMGQHAIVTFSDPNANKPLHLGHLRNNFIGMALKGLMESQGYTVETHATLSDWGIHICQAIAAYVRWGNGAIPTAGTKGDHLVGRYYVRFHAENERAHDAGDELDEPIAGQAADLLRRMEQADEEALLVNERVTGWATAGIEETYARIGSRFDGVFRESETLTRAHEVLAEAVRAGVCARRADGSVYIDLSKLNLGEVTLVRSDGTPTVLTQMLGIDDVRFRRPFDKVLSIFGREWEASANGYVEMLRRLGYAWAERYEPVYYGMVRLPEGRMQSREGRIVGADELLDEVSALLQEHDWGLDGPAPSGEAVDRLACGLVKYAFLRVRRNRDLPYDESTLRTRTLPAFSLLVRTAALAHRIASEPANGADDHEPSRPLLLHLNAFGGTVQTAARYREPATVLRYLDALCASFDDYRRQCVVAPDVARATEVVIARALSILNMRNDCIVEDDESSSGTTLTNEFADART